MKKVYNLNHPKVIATISKKIDSLIKKESVYYTDDYGPQHDYDPSDDMPSLEEEVLGWLKEDGPSIFEYEETESLYDSEEFMLDAIEVDPRAIVGASYDLLEDEDFLYEAVMVDSSVLTLLLNPTEFDSYQLSSHESVVPITQELITKWEHKAEIEGELGYFQDLVEDANESNPSLNFQLKLDPSEEAREQRVFLRDSIEDVGKIERQLPDFLIPVLDDAHLTQEDLKDIKPVFIHPDAKVYSLQKNMGAIKYINFVKRSGSPLFIALTTKLPSSKHFESTTDSTLFSLSGLWVSRGLDFSRLLSFLKKIYSKKPLRVSPKDMVKLKEFSSRMSQVELTSDKVFLKNSSKKIDFAKLTGDLDLDMLLVQNLNNWASGEKTFELEPDYPI